MSRRLFTNIRELVTMAPLAAQERTTKVQREDLGILEDAWLLVDGPQVSAFGTGTPPEGVDERCDLAGAFVCPGLVDAHTHPLFGGNRSHEFAARLDGKSYQDIARDGGGIAETLRASREATDDELFAGARGHLARFLAHGVTTVEVKSGYGQSVDEELRHLRLLRRLAEEVAQTLRVSCLALHALPPEATSAASFVEEMTTRLLPVVAAEQLADDVDAFVEKGYFPPELARPYFLKARKLGFGLRLHADEFAPSGAAELAAELGALSADHLQAAEPAGVAAMAEAGVTAVMLPGTSLYTSIPYAQGRSFADAGCPVAIATDFNPGSCAIANLPMLAAVAGLAGGLNSAEVMAAVTYVPARSLRLEGRKGALAPGYDADFLVHPAGSHVAWLADFGQTAPREVWIQGQRRWGEVTA